MSIHQLGDARAVARNRCLGHYDPEGVRTIERPSREAQDTLRDALLRTPESGSDASGFMRRLAGGLRATRGLERSLLLERISAIRGTDERVLTYHDDRGRSVLHLPKRPPANYLLDVLRQLGTSLPRPQGTALPLRPTAGAARTSRQPLVTRPSADQLTLMRRAMRIEEALGETYALRVLDDMLDLDFTITDDAAASVYFRDPERLAFHVLRGEGLPGLTRYLPALMDSTQQDVFDASVESMASVLTAADFAELERALDWGGLVRPEIPATHLDTLVAAEAADRGLFTRTTVPNVLTHNKTQWTRVLSKRVTTKQHLADLVLAMTQMAPGLREPLTTRWQREDVEIVWEQRPGFGGGVFAYDLNPAYLYGATDAKLTIRVPPNRYGVDLLWPLAEFLLGASMAPDDSFRAIDIAPAEDEASVRARVTERTVDRFGRAYAYGLAGRLEFAYQAAQSAVTTVASPLLNSAEDFLTRYGLRAMGTAWRHVTPPQMINLVEQQFGRSESFLDITPLP